MKNKNKFFIYSLILLMTICFSHSAFAAKTLSLGTASVSNTGDAAARTATIPVTLKGGANDVNGLVFTIHYDPDVFSFSGLVKGDMNIDDGSTYDPSNPPSADTIKTTLYYQTNDKPTAGIVMIAAAAANFFTNNTSADFVPFKAKFKVKLGTGNGVFPVNLQKTIIGPDTAKNAGYDVPTLLAVAAGLDPAKDPTTATTYDVVFAPGAISVSGGYDVTGTAVYGGTPVTNVDGAEAKLITILPTGEFPVASVNVKNGAYTFSKVSAGTYKVEILSTKPGYQKSKASASFDVVDAKITVPKITLAKYTAKSGKITINGSSLNLSGLKVEIRDNNGNVIGVAAVDANGNYVTMPLPSPLPSNYTIWAVYGTSEVDITSEPASYDWSLSLGSVSGTIAGLCTGQTIELLIRSDSTKIQKSLMITEGVNDGSYSLTNLLPGNDYILSAVGEGIGPVYYNGTDVKGTEDFSNAAKIAVTAGKETKDKGFTFTCTDLATISGTISVKANGTTTNIKNTRVKANNFDFNQWKFGSAMTDASGQFTIKVSKSNDYYVYFTYNGQTYYYKDNSGTPEAVTDRSEATLVDVTAGDAASINIPVVIATPDTAKLEGHVSLNRSIADSGVPLENYLIALFSKDNIPLGFVSRTDKTGYYLFDKIPPATYNVVLLPPYPYARQVEEGVVLANDATATADFIVNQNFKITGAVMDATVANTPIAGARVDIIKSDGGKLRSAVFTDAKGSYTFVEIPSGVYTLIASHKDYFPNSQEETVSSDLTATTILLTKGAIIKGVVSDDKGVAVDEAGVTLRGQNYTKFTRTDKNGNYEFKGLAANSDHIIKAAKGTKYRPFTPQDVTTTGAGTIVTKNLTLVLPTTTHTFGGTVKEESGNAVAKAYVMLSSNSTGYAKVVMTDTSGAFTFDNVIDGTDYSLLVLPGNQEPYILQTIGDIKADKTNYAVVVKANAVISGTITLSEADSSAMVIAGAYDPVKKLVHEVRAVDSGSHTAFTYSIKVKSGVNYKVFAQNIDGTTFPLQYYIDGTTSGTYSQATDVQGTQTNINIKLTK